MLPKTDEFFFDLGGGFSPNFKGACKHGLLGVGKVCVLLVLESSGISSYVTGIMVHHNYSQSMLSVAVKKAVCLVLLCRA